MQRLAGVLASKTQRPYSQLLFYIRVRLSIALVKATHLCLRGSRKRTTPHSTYGPQFIPPDPADPSPEFRLMFHS